MSQSLNSACVAPQPHVVVWIDVDRMQPPRGVHVLIACADGVQQGFRRGQEFRSCLRGEDAVYDVTHWAYLPEHPLNIDFEMASDRAHD